MFWMKQINFRKVHLSIVHNPAMASHKEFPISGFASRYGHDFMACLRVKSIFINFDWV